MCEVYGLILATGQVSIDSLMTTSYAFGLVYMGMHEKSRFPKDYDVTKSAMRLTNVVARYPFSMAI